MELSQQKKQIIFKTCYIVLILAIAGILCCRLYEGFYSMNVYNKTQSSLNADAEIDLENIKIYNLFLAISIVDIVKNFILISILLLSIISCVSKLKNYKLIFYIQASSFITISLVLNIVSNIIKYINSLLFPLAYSGQPLMAIIITMFIILIFSLALSIYLIIKETKLLKNKSSSNPACEG